MPLDRNPRLRPRAALARTAPFLLPGHAPLAAAHVMARCTRRRHVRPLLGLRDCACAAAAARLSRCTVRPRGQSRDRR